MIVVYKGVHIMKKASKILLIIAGVFNLLACIALFIVGLVYAIIAFAGGALIFGEYTAEIQALVESWGVTEEALRWIVAAIFALIYLVVFGALAIIYLVGSIIAFKGGKPKKKGIFIANIVFAVICENIFSLVGSILGLIGYKNGFESEAQPQEEPLPEPEPEPAPAEIEEKKPEPEPEIEEPKEEPKPKKDASRWFCPNCGAENTSKFCSSCGTKRPE